MELTKDNILEILSNVIHPETKENIFRSEIFNDLHLNDNCIEISLTFSKPTDPFINSIKRSIKENLEKNFGNNITIDIKTKIESKTTTKKAEPNGINEVKNIIAVASGKGGVGKSTVTVNLAISLAQQGYKVAVIDADIFGPSIPKMFGVEDERPKGIIENGIEYIVPIEKYGIKMLSVGFFISHNDVAMWRGPMATSVLRQLITQAKWGEIDYLLFDLPPGTSDIHLTLVQTVPVTGAVIVSTPQDVAISDARKGIAMFNSKGIEVPVLGLIENMAWFIPAELPQNKYYIFGKGGAEKLAKELRIPLLSQIPLVQSVCESGDSGRPIALNPDSIDGKAFNDLADKLLEKIDERNKNIPPTKQVNI